jgi:hypothetical protein
MQKMEGHAIVRKLRPVVWHRGFPIVFRRNILGRNPDFIPELST